MADGGTRRGRTIALHALTAVLSATLAAGGVYVWQSQTLRAAERRATAAEVSRASLETRVAALQARLAASEPSRSVPPSSSPAVETTVAPPRPTGESGRWFCFIRSLAKTGERYVADVDYAQFLTGDAAAKAAKVAGKESPPPNDYFIVNDSKKLRAFPVAPDTKVTFHTADWADKSVTLEQFAGWFSGGGSWEEHVRVAPYWITLEDGTITRIEEQYLP